MFLFCVGMHNGAALSAALPLINVAAVRTHESRL